MLRISKLSLQTKIILILLVVIIPTFSIVTFVANKVTGPLLEQEFQQMGITAAQSLELKILANNWLSDPLKYKEIEEEILEMKHAQPSIFHIEVYVKQKATNQWVVAASNIAGETGTTVDFAPEAEELRTELRSEREAPYWEINLPVRQSLTTDLAPGKQNAVIHLHVSTSSVRKVISTFWKVSVIGSIVSIAILILIFGYLLKRIFLNVRLSKKIEVQNEQLSQQLHETQRELMNIEKLTVMGQLTAKFAHEIGTPLNAMGLHLQLLNEEHPSQRIGVITGELKRIESIVRGFLQTTAKPATQIQLVDLNREVDKTLGIMQPRLESLGVKINVVLNRSMGPLRCVPTDIEQILLNLLNNSCDSLGEKRKTNPAANLEISIKSYIEKQEGRDWAKIIIRDTGQGIKKEDMQNLMKPFFTTKKPGQGTGLGLAICHELIGIYHGDLKITSKEGSWAEAEITLPYGVNV